MSAQAGTQIRRKRARKHIDRDQTTRVLVALVACLYTRTKFETELAARVIELSPRVVNRELRTLRRALLAEGNRPSWQGIARVEALIGRGLQFGPVAGRAVEYSGGQHT